MYIENEKSYVMFIKSFVKEKEELIFQWKEIFK